MAHAARIVWETHWELEARLRGAATPARRAALRMLLALREQDDLGDFELGELVGRPTHEVWQWWSIYANEGLGRLLELSDHTPWLAISGIALPKQVDPVTLPFGVTGTGSSRW